MGINEKKFTVIPNAVNVVQFNIITKTDGFLLNNLRLNNNCYVHPGNENYSRVELLWYFTLIPFILYSGHYLLIQRPDSMYA